MTDSDIQNLRDLNRDLARLRALIHLYERALEGNPSENADQLRKRASEDWWLNYRQRLHSRILDSRKSAARARSMLDRRFPGQQLGFEVQVLLDDLQDWFLRLAAGPVVPDGSFDPSHVRPRLEMLATRVRHAVPPSDPEPKDRQWPPLIKRLGDEAKARKCLLVLKNLRREAGDTVLRQDLKRIGLPPTSVDQDFQAYGQGRSTMQGAQKAFTTAYIEEFVLKRWKPR